MATTKKKSRAAMASPSYDYQAEDDLHHLTRAAEVKADPKRHKAAIAVAQKRIKAMQTAASVAPNDPVADTDQDGA